MILNDTLQKHQDCLEQCELGRVTCEGEKVDDATCEVITTNCQRDCDFDYGP